MADVEVVGAVKARGNLNDFRWPVIGHGVSPNLGEHLRQLPIHWVIFTTRDWDRGKDKRRKSLLPSGL